LASGDHCGTTPDIRERHISALRWCLDDLPCLAIDYSKTFDGGSQKCIARRAVVRRAICNAVVYEADIERFGGKKADTKGRL
jgi:hypothetical protein